jgi:CubicO group peptidase (beta-lactamase class C family)
VADLELELDQHAAETGFSGVVRVDREGRVELEEAYGMAHRGFSVPNTVGTRFGIASGTKGLTALAVIGLVEEGALELETTARSLLGRDLPLVPDDVTVELLLAHRSGIGDYLDEEGGVPIEQYELPVPTQKLSGTEDYLLVLDGHPPKFAAGERFAYCDSGYVVLALLAERASGTPFAELVRERVCRPARMDDTEFLRSDELPGGVATGYLEPVALQTNVFRLPVRGSGDGGIYSTVRDVRSLWTAFFGGRIVSRQWVTEMVRPRSSHPSGARYGLGFWLDPEGEGVALEGFDAGVSFRSRHDPRADLTHTVISNTTHGAWPMWERLEELLRT